MSVWEALPGRRRNVSVTAGIISSNMKITGILRMCLHNRYIHVNIFFTLIFYILLSLIFLISALERMKKTIMPMPVHTDDTLGSWPYRAAAMSFAYTAGKNLLIITKGF